MHLSAERSRQIADIIGEYEAMNATANAGKSDTWEAVREELRGMGLRGGEISLEIAKLKRGVAMHILRTTNPEKAQATDERDEGAVEYLHAIETAASRVHVHTRGKVTEKVPAPPESRAGHISAPGPEDAAPSDEPGPLSGGAAPAMLGYRIVSDPEIHDGAPIIAGTRIQTSAVRRFAEDGWQADAIIEEFPDLTKADVAAALQFEAMRAAAELKGTTSGFLAAQMQRRARPAEVLS